MSKNGFGEVNTLTWLKLLHYTSETHTWSIGEKDYSLYGMFYKDEDMHIEYRMEIVDGELDEEIELNFKLMRGSIIAHIPYLWVVRKPMERWGVVAFKDGKWKKHIKRVYKDFLQMVSMMKPLEDAVKYMEDMKINSGEKMEPKFENGVWVCPVCGERFMSKKVAQMHIDRNHPQEARSDPPENGQILDKNPGVSKKNTHKNDRAERDKKKAKNNKKANKKGPKYKKFKIGDTWIKVLKRPEVEIKDHTGWRFWTTANYTASLHKKKAKIKLLTGEEFTGLVKTKDPFFIALKTDEGRKLLIHKGAVAFIEVLQEEDDLEAWEYVQSSKLICPNHGVIARVDIYEDAWLQMSTRWAFGKENVKLECKPHPTDKHRFTCYYICVKCGSRCEMEKTYIPELDK